MPLVNRSADASAGGLAAQVLLGAGVVLLALPVLLVRAYCYAIYAVAAIRYPFALDYGEGIVWQQAALIPGPLMYGRIDHYPFIVFHYPPAYHLVTRLLATVSGMDLLAAGRSLSVLSTATTVLCVSALIVGLAKPVFGRAPAAFGALVGSLVILTFHPVVVWSPLMRVDMLALAASFAGVVMAVAARARPRLAYMAALAFVLAVYTKQTAIAAPIATFGVMFAADPRGTIKPALAGLLVAGAVLLVLSLATGGRFLEHIIVYNINRYSIAALVRLCAQEAPQAGFLLLAIPGIAVAVALVRGSLKGRAARLACRLRNDKAAFLAAVLLAWFAAATAMLATLGKSGGSLNYFLEWMCLWGVFIGVTVALVAHSAMRPALHVPVMRLVPAALCVLALQAQIALLPKPDMSPFRPSRQQALSELTARIRAAPGPVLSDDMVLLMRAGKQVPLEPAIFAELAAGGLWDQQKEIGLLRSRFFSFVVTQGGRGDRLFDSRYNPDVADALYQAYPDVTLIAGYEVHSQAGRSPEAAVGPVRPQG